MQIAVIGAGIGGLSLALACHAKGIPVQVLEAAPSIQPLGVGINLLPHGSRVMRELGMEDVLRQISIETKEAIFFDGFGKFIYREAAGIDGGFGYPQFSIHRGYLQLALRDAVRQRLGEKAVRTGVKCTGVTEGAGSVTLALTDAVTGAVLPPMSVDMVVAADGIHSVVRKQFYPEEGAPVYSGINMWRGVTRMKPFLSGASQVRAGSLRTGKMVIYPIQDNIDSHGRQLVNWVAELSTSRYEKNDWNRKGQIDDFLPFFKTWTFDWLDVPAMIEAADTILEYPMVDRDPLPRWSFGRVTLLGDAAHPMYPRGSNGAAQAILDAEKLAEVLARGGPIEQVLADYDLARRPLANAVVERNRTMPPDYLIETVYDRTGGQPFDHIDDVISQDELCQLMRDYQNVAGWDPAKLATSASASFN